MNKVLVILIPFVMMGVLFIGGLGIYNGLVSAQEEAKKFRALVENQYQRGADVIPNLVEAFKGHTQQEKGVLGEITRLRNQWGEARQSGGISKSLQAARGLDGGLAKLIAVGERYPELKSKQNFMKLQDQLRGIEKLINVERRRYNQAVQNYNKNSDVSWSLLCRTIRTGEDALI